MPDALVGEVQGDDDAVQISGQEPPEDTDDGDSVDDVMPVPFYGLAAPTGGPSDDRRVFSARGLTWRALPLPLTYQISTAPGHDNAVTVGYITDMWYDENDFIAYKGTFADPTLEPYVDKVIGGIAEGWIRGVSVDVVAAQYELPAIPDQFESAEQVLEMVQNPPNQVMKAGKVAGLCVVGIPAFEDTYIRVGDCDCGADEMPADVTVPPLEVGIAEDGSEKEYGDLTEEEREAYHAEREAFAKGLLDIVDDDPEMDAFVASVKATEGVPEGEAINVLSLVAAAFAPGTHDGPGWITHPVATNRIRRYWVHGKGAAKIGWGAPNDFYRCRGQLRKYVSNPDWLSGLCANMHKEALGVWPGQEGGGNHGHGSLLASAEEMNMAPAAPYNIVASAAAPTLPERAWFSDPGLTGPTALQVTDDGHVFGHVATWNVCHIGMQGKCTTAPRSSSGYMYFKTGIVRTTDGDVAVGHITMGTGHASLNKRAFDAASHYDNTGTVAADVNVGEDQYGIWVSGAMRATATEEQKFALRAAALSGDWRTIQGRKEMVAALAVNVPGFPIPRTEALVASGEEALVAAAVVVPDAPTWISGGEITATKIAAGAITSDMISANTITAASLNTIAPVSIEKSDQASMDAAVKASLARIERVDKAKKARVAFTNTVREDYASASRDLLIDMMNNLGN